MSTAAEKVARLVAQQFTGAEVTDVEWAWRIRINAQMYCCLRKDMLWALTSAGTAFDIFDDLHQALPEQEMVDKLVGIVQGLMVVLPAAISLVTMPQLIVRDKRICHVGMVRKKEVDRLQAEADIFKNYQVYRVKKH